MITFGNPCAGRRASARLGALSLAVAACDPSPKEELLNVVPSALAIRSENAATQPQWSGDGRWVVFRGVGGGLNALDLRSGRLRSIASFGTDTVVGPFRVTGSDEVIGVVSVAQGSPASSLFRFPLNGDVAERLLAFPTGTDVGILDVSPDGRYVVWGVSPSGMSVDRTIWVLDRTSRNSRGPLSTRARTVAVGPSGTILLDSITSVGTHHIVELGPDGSRGPTIFTWSDSTETIPWTSGGVIGAQWRPNGIDLAGWRCRFDPRNGSGTTSLRRVPSAEAGPDGIEVGRLDWGCPSHIVWLPEDRFLAARVVHGDGSATTAPVVVTIQSVRTNGRNEAVYAGRTPGPVAVVFGPDIRVQLSPVGNGVALAAWQDLFYKSLP